MRWITTDIITIIKYWRYHYFVTPWEYFTPSEYIQMERWEERGERSTSHLSSCHPVVVTRSDLWTFKQSAKIISVMEWKWGRELLHFTLWIINHGKDKKRLWSVFFFVLTWHFPNRNCIEETELTKSYNLQCHISAINCQNNKEPAKFIQNMLN